MKTTMTQAAHTPARGLGRRSGRMVGLLLACGLSLQAWAGGVLRVGTTGDYPPFSYRDPASGQYRGSDIDQAGRLATALGRRVAFVPTTWKSLLADQAAGRFDIAMGGISILADRQAQGAFSVPYLQDGKTPIARCGEVDRYQTVAQLNQPQVRLVVNPGGSNERYVRALLPAATLLMHPDNITIFDEISAGRADVMVTDAIETRLQQQLRPGLCAIHPDQPFERSQKAYWLAQGSPLKREVDRWLRRSIASGQAAATLEQWLVYPWPEGPARTLALLVDERLSLMPEVARYKWNQQAAIEDLPRDRALVESVRALAAARGLSPDRAAAFFEAQIEASKVIQRELFAQWKAAGQGRFDSVVDLATQIRPRLDALNPRLLDALAAVPAPVARPQLGEFKASAFSPAAVQAAVAPLTGGHR